VEAATKSKEPESPTLVKTDPSKRETQTASNSTDELSVDENQFVEFLHEMGGCARSRSEIQTKLKWGTTKTMRIIKSLVAKKVLKVAESSHRNIVKLLERPLQNPSA
jgi:DNA-binding MarR family transcriptional regulator